MGEVKGFELGRNPRSRSVQSIYVGYKAGEVEYTGKYFSSNSDTTTRVEVRYLIFAPSISRENTWIGNWAGPILFFIIAFIITTIVFLQDGVIPFSASFQLGKKPPFVRMLIKT